MYKVILVLANLIILIFLNCVNTGSPFTNQNKLPKFLNKTTNKPILNPSEAGYYGYSINEGFSSVYEWRIMDFMFPTYAARKSALTTGKFVPENTVPLGVDRLDNRLFVTTPRWKNGIPASLSWLPLPAKELSPPLMPYPNWEAHGDPENPDCNKLISVYRTFIDECSRLWIIDAGVINATIKLNQVCLPKIVVYNLKNDALILSYVIPQSQVKEDSLHTNIIVDIRNGKCNDAFAYIADVWRFGIVVFSLAKRRSWRTTNYLYYPNPEASDFTLHELNFQWTDGVFGMSLSPLNEYNDRILYYHPMASFKEFAAATSVLRDESLWSGYGPAKSFISIGSRGKRGQSTTSGIDRNRIMFFTLVQQDSIACWDINKPYNHNNIVIIEQNRTTLFFPNDLKVDNEWNQGLWVLSNRLPVYLYSKLNYNDVNFRILRASTTASVEGTLCDPRMRASHKSSSLIDECY